MILSQNLCDALNQQILHELGNVTKYMQINSYFENLQLKNLAKYFLARSQEEKGHADKFMNYINDRTGGLVTIGEVQEPNLALTDPASIGVAFVQIEENTTLSIESIFDLALGEKSYLDLPFLQEMLSEQVGEEDEANEFALKIKMVKDIVLFDATLGD
jgi:ferritin